MDYWAWEYDAAKAEYDNTGKVSSLSTGVLLGRCLNKTDVYLVAIGAEAARRLDRKRSHLELDAAMITISSFDSNLLRRAAYQILIAIG